MKRRSFLRQAALTAAACGFPSIVRAQTLGLGGGTAPSNRITLGAIGVGGQGMGVVVNNALGIDAAQVVAVCDVDRAHRETAKKKVEERYANRTGQAAGNSCSMHLDMTELFARKDIDAVLISTPDHWHALACVGAAATGKHIYCEKPAASSIPEGRAMLDAVRRAGVVCQIGSQQRSGADFQRAVDLARFGYLGRITKVEVGLPAGWYGSPQASELSEEKVPEGFDYARWVGPAVMRPYHKARCHFTWRWSFDFAGGQLSDWIGHHFDIAAVAMGVSHTMPVAIRDASATFIDNHPLYNTAAQYAFQAHYAGGQVLSVSTKHRNGLRVEGEQGWVYVTRGVIEHSSESLRRLILPTRQQILGLGPRGHMDDFITAVRTGTEPRCPILEAHCVAAVSHLANAAFRTGRRELRWDPVAEQVIDAPDAAAILRRTYHNGYVLPA